MRKRKRDDLARLIDEVVIGVLEPRLRAFFGDAAQERLGESDRIVKAIEQIRPASVDLTQEMADDIVRKIHGPLTISREFSDWCAEQAKHGDCVYTFQIGYGSDAGRGLMRLDGNGAMHLDLYDCTGAFLWRGTFVPPGFGT